MIILLMTLMRSLILKGVLEPIGSLAMRILAVAMILSTSGP